MHSNDKNQNKIKKIKRRNKIKWVEINKPYTLTAKQHFAKIKNKNVHLSARKICGRQQIKVVARVKVRHKISPCFWSNMLCTMCTFRLKTKPKLWASIYLLTKFLAKYRIVEEKWKKNWTKTKTEYNQKKKNENESIPHTTLF